MSHVDEGELTAYADGAYASDDADAQRIAAHLAVCANCRNRLALAQMLTARAGEILAVAAPAVVAAPPFEQLQGRAAGRAPGRRQVPLAWAASVILAIGLGWLGRGALVREPDQIANAPGRASAPAAMGERENGQTGERANEVAAGMAAKTAATPTGPPTRPEEIAQGEARPLVSPTAAPPSANALNSFATGRAAADAAAAPLGDRDVEYMTAAEAERRGLELHIVPELEVLRVGVKAGETLVEQKLPDGKILTIASIPVRIDETQMDVRKEKDSGQRERKAVAAPAPAPVALGVIVMRGAARIRVFANLPADSLQSLAAKIR